jgi:hypothetical protein
LAADEYRFLSRSVRRESVGKKSAARRVAFERSRRYGLGSSVFEQGIFMIGRGRLLSALFLFAAALAAGTAHAQSGDGGPLATAAGSLQFVREGASFAAQIDGTTFDRFNAPALRHFDDPSGARGTVARMLVESPDGPVLYDLRRNPPVVERIGRGMKVNRVFWQGPEVVMQGPDGWFRFERGTLTKLQSSKTIYH